MADNDDEKKQEDEETEKTGETTQAKTGLDTLTWVIMAVVVVVCAGAGIGLSRLLAGPASTETTVPARENLPAEKEQPQKEDDSQTGPGRTWYYELEPVVANPDEHNATRFIRMTIILQMNTIAEKKMDITELIEKKNPVLINWLNIYLGSLKIEDCTGNKKKRIQLQILDALNEILFPDAKPKIEKILLKEFVIQ